MIKIYLGTFSLYFLLAVVTGFLSWLSQLSKNRVVKEILILVATLPPAIVAGIRYEVGTDYSGYLTIFNGLWRTDNVEIGFYSLIDFIKLFTNNVQVLFFMMALITINFTLRGLFAYREEINIGISMFTFMLSFYLTGLNVSRQLVAVGIGFYAIQFIFKKKPIIFALVVCVALMFHLSMVAIIPLYFIYNSRILKINKITIIILAILAVLLLFNLDIIASFISSYVPQFQSRIGYFIKKPYFDFTTLGVLKDIMYIIPSIYIYPKYKNNEKFNFFLLIYILSIIFGLAANLYINSAINRITIPLEMSLLYLVPYVVRKSYQNRNYFLLSSNLIIVIVIFYWDFFIMGFGEIVPFRTIF